MVDPNCAATLRRLRAASLVLLAISLPAASRAAIDGYVSPQSAAPGDTLSFMVSSPTAYDVIMARYHRVSDGNVADPLTSPVTYPAVVQAVPDSAWKGCGWTAAFRWVIPVGWASGIYAAECSHAGVTTMQIPFVVRPRLGVHGDFAMLANTNTWNAYNSWGGRSKYSVPPAHEVSFLRPNPGAAPSGTGPSHLTRAELWVQDWLGASGYHVDVYSDLDLQRGILELSHYKGLILNTHPEYWTHEMLDRLEAYLNNGGCVMYLAGNGIYEETVFSADGNTLTMYPEYWCGEKTCRDRSYLRNLSPPRPERAILGVAYRTEGFKTYAPFQVLLSAHRFFQGTGLVDGSLIGASGLNAGGASGWEMDTSIPGLAPDGVIVSATGADDRGSPPANIELLARGTNSGGYGADMTYYSTASGGGVFAAGSLTFGGSLVIDPVLQRIVRNVLDEFLRRPLAVAGPNPAGPAGAPELRSASPNPFTRETSIRFTLTRAGRIRLTVHDVSGRRVRRLLDGAQLPANDNSIRWDGLDDSGRTVPDGVYLVRLETSTRRDSRAVLRLR